MYPLVAKKFKDIAEEFRKRMLNPEAQKTLFTVIVDECHYAPTKTAIPFLHDEEVMNLPNVVFLLVSATPYNVLSNTSTVVKSLTNQAEVERVIDWYGIVKEDPIQDTYIGFEYYARSTVFTVDETRNELHVTFGQVKKSLSFILKEYAQYEAFLEDLNNSLGEFVSTERVLYRSLFNWDYGNRKVKVSSRLREVTV